MKPLAALGEWVVGPNYSDSRVAEWAFIGVGAPLGLTIAYLVGIPIGNRIMKNRQPLKLKGFVAIHNMILFALSLYMFLETVMQAYQNFNWGKRFLLWCTPVEPGTSFSPSGYRLARVLWIHYLSKAYEFVDTYIMILKKNTRQISFLHVYHHATTFFPCWWSTMKYAPGGEPYFACAFNSFIHVLMYGYYFLASLGVNLSMIKPFVTYSQMFQFLCYIMEAYVVIRTDCFHPRLVPLILGAQATVFFILFANFALKTYGQKAKRAKTE